MKALLPQAKTNNKKTQNLKRHSSLIPHQLRFVDLFAGIGGFRLGLEKAGYQCVYSCELNPACQEVYYQNFGEYPDSDITKVNLNNIPNFEILTAGFPCQPFSICGKRRGFEDTRGTLFFHVCELIESHQPEVILLENVKYLLHQDKGKTLNVILYSLEDLGYLVSYKLINAKDFGVPQNRERVVIVATKTKKFNFDKLKTNQDHVPLRNYLSSSHNFEYLNPEDYILIEHPKQQKSGLMFVGYRSNKSIWKKGVRPNTEHLSRVHRQPNRIYSIDGLHPTLPSQETSGRFFIYIPEENAVRKLTIEECYKIMGFPETFKRHSNLGESYKQIGNSVCVPMIYELGLEIKEQIFSETQDLPNPEKKINNSPLQLTIPGLCMNHKEKLLQVYQNSESIDDVSSTEKHPKQAQAVLQILLYQSRMIKDQNKITITKLDNTEKLAIKTIINFLDQHFNFNYKTSGASKLPVLAFYAIYKLLIAEIERYQYCTLNPLGSHTASDRTSRTSGDIEILDPEGNLFEGVEIKHGKPIDLQMIRIAKDKIYRFNPRRYCLYSSADVKGEEEDIINEEIKEIAATHGCQVIVNGILPTLKYYLRLVMSLEKFVNEYSILVEQDQELKAVHKTKWNELIDEIVSF